MHESQVPVPSGNLPGTQGRGPLVERIAGWSARHKKTAAILIDATVVRGVLLPAALALLGDRAWPAPNWLLRPGNPS